MMRHALLIGVSALAYAGTAAAQTASVPADPTAPAPATITTNPPSSTTPDDAASASAAAGMSSEGDGQQQNSAAAPTDVPVQDSGRDIVVTGIRESLERAAQIKQRAPQIVDSIVAQDIGKFPDPTTAAALQRVPGVQVAVTQTNEIGNVRIRGLGDILTTLDGREVFTATGRTFSLTDLPADALARVDVIKSNTADLIEGGIAGSIDLKLNKPFNFKRPTLIVSARGNYGLYSDRIDPQIGALATKTFHTGIGDIGVLVNATWYKTHYNHPRTREGVRRSALAAPYNLPGVLMPNVVEGHVEYGEYQRPEVNASVQWQASDHLQVYADGLYTGYRTNSQWSLANAQLFLPGTTVSNLQLSDECITARAMPNGQSPLPSVNNRGTLDPSDDIFTLPAFTVQNLCKVQSATFRNAVSEQKTYSYHNTTDNYLGAFGLKYDSDEVNANLEGSYQRSDAINETVLAVIGERIPEFQYVANTGKGSIQTTPGDAYLAKERLYIYEGLDQNFQKATGDLLAVQGNSSFKIDSDFLKLFQVGFRYADRGAVYQQAFVTTTAPFGQLGTASEARARLVTDTGLPADYLYVRPGVPGQNDNGGALVPNPDFLRSASGRDQIRTLYGLPTGDPAYQPQRRFDAAETTVAGYAQIAYQVTLGGMSLDGVVGVRPTRTERTIKGSSTVTIPAAGTTPARTEIRPLSATTIDTDVLPNASARLQIGGGVQLRASYSETIRRPDFASLNPGISYSLSTNPNILNSGSSGNPDLLPQKSQSYDASLEWYFRRGFVAIAGYKRDITNRVVTAASNELIDGINYSISRPRNIGQAELKGIEVSGQTFFDFLPGPLSGFGLMGNFTYADTKVKGADRLAGLPLQGVSKYNYNVGVLYEKYGVSARAVYTYRSKYYDDDVTGALGIREVDPARASDPSYNPLLLNYVRPSGRLDIGVNWDVNSNLRIDFGGTNVLRAKYRGYYNDPWAGQEYRYDDTTYTLGVRVRL